MTDRITLTDEDKEILREWARGDEVYAENWDETLFTAVESIIAAREAKAAAKALRDAADTWTTASIPPSIRAWLRALANEYDPQESA